MKHTIKETTMEGIYTVDIRHTDGGHTITHYPDRDTAVNVYNAAAWSLLVQQEGAIQEVTLQTGEGEIIARQE